MTDTEFSRSERRRLEDEAVELQFIAAKAHAFVDMKVDKRFALILQDNAASFAHRARECLFELIGSEPDEYAALAGFLLVLASWGFWWAATPA